MTETQRKKIEEEFLETIAETNREQVVLIDKLKMMLTAPVIRAPESAPSQLPMIANVDPPAFNRNYTYSTDTTQEGRAREYCLYKDSAVNLDIKIASPFSTDWAQVKRLAKMPPIFDKFDPHIFIPARGRLIEGPERIGNIRRVDYTAKRRLVQFKASISGIQMIVTVDDSQANNLISKNIVMKIAAAQGRSYEEVVETKPQPVAKLCYWRTPQVCTLYDNFPTIFRLDRYVEKDNQVSKDGSFVIRESLNVVEEWIRPEDCCVVVGESFIQRKKLSILSSKNLVSFYRRDEGRITKGSWVVVDERYPTDQMGMMKYNPMNRMFNTQTLNELTRPAPREQVGVSLLSDQDNLVKMFLDNQQRERQVLEEGPQVEPDPLIDLSASVEEVALAAQAHPSSSRGVPVEPIVPVPVAQPLPPVKRPLSEREKLEKERDLKIAEAVWRSEKDKPEHRVYYAEVVKRINDKYDALRRTSGESDNGDPQIVYEESIEDVWENAEEDEEDDESEMVKIVVAWY